jgi:hypothetical protein
MAPELYAEWLHYIRMEELSHQIYQILLPQEQDKETLRNISKQLLTTMDEEKYVASLEGLVHKVFKEEWVKTMLARGVNPETVMEKIDEYWDSREMEQNRNQAGKPGQRFAGESLRDSQRGKDKHQSKKRFEGDHDRDRKHDRKHDRNKTNSNAPGLKRKLK